MSNSGRLLKRIVFGTAGALLISIAVGWSLTTRQFVQKADRAQGTVVRLNYGSAHPQIRFKDKIGKTVEYAQGGLIFGYQANERVEVLYTSDDKQIDTFGALYGFTLLALLAGIAFGITALRIR